MLKQFAFGILLLCYLPFPGCSSHKIPNYSTSGFLNNYSGFEVGTEDQPNLVYINPEINLKSYDKLLIDHVVVFFNPESDNKGIEPDKLMELTDYFHRALVNELKTRFVIVKEAGAGVLQLRCALTDVEPGKPVQGALTTVVPVGAAVSLIKKTTSDSHIAVGRASVEIELADSLSGKRLAAAIDRREGGTKVVSSKWGDVEEAFEYWAAKLGLFIDKQQNK